MCAPIVVGIGCVVDAGAWTVTLAVTGAAGANVESPGLFASIVQVPAAL